jgi:hypothetical protein
VAQTVGFDLAKSKTLYLSMGRLTPSPPNLRFCAPNYDVARFGTLHGSAEREATAYATGVRLMSGYGMAAVGAKQSPTISWRCDY